MSLNESWSELTVNDLAQWRQDGHKHTLIDVREDWELAEASLPDVVHIRMQEIPEHLEAIQALQQPVVLMCHAGIRSAQCATWLAHHGVTEIYNLHGGIHAWAQDIDPSVGFY